MDPTPLICRACGARPENAAEGDRCPNGDMFLIRPDVSRRHARDFFLGHALEGDYVLLDVLGKGGFGTVYRALDRKLGRPVAVKVLHANLAQSDSVRARFDREARAIASLRHAAVVDVYRFGERRPTKPGEPHILYMVLEYIDGRTLKDELRARGRLSPMEALRITVPVLQALAEAHDQGIVHRDLKPANIMLAPGSGRPEVRMLDFGIAKVLDDDTENPLTGVGMLLGTAKYMPPEQIRNDGVGPAADLYALGVILYEMLAGKPPFVEETGRAYLLAHISKAVPRLPAEAGVPPDLELVVRTALSKQPAERYRNAREMLAALFAAVPGGEMLSGQYLFSARGVSPPFSGPIRPYSGPQDVALADTATTPEPAMSIHTAESAPPTIDGLVEPSEQAREGEDPPEPRFGKRWLALVFMLGLVVLGVVSWPESPREPPAIAPGTHITHDEAPDQPSPPDAMMIFDASLPDAGPVDSSVPDTEPLPPIDSEPPQLSAAKKKPRRGKAEKALRQAPPKPAPDAGAKNDIVLW